MLDDIFSHFRLVMFLPGHMGTFLQYFLSPIQSKKSIIHLNPLEQFGKFENHEWQYTDVFDTFFAEDFNVFKELVDLINQNYSEDDVFKITALTILNTKYYIIKNNIGNDTRQHMPLVLEFAKNPLDPNFQIPLELLKTISIKYVKGHPFKRYPNINATLSNIKWKNKIIRCEFPDEKSWISFYLLKYKYSNSPHHIISLTSITNDLLLKLDKFYIDIFSYAKYNNDIYDKNDYLNFDMYNLVINKNLNQVYEVDPDFEFTNEKKKILELANRTSLEILESYGLDHHSSIKRYTTIREVFNMQKLNPKP